MLKASDQFEVLQANSPAEDNIGMATPAKAGDRLLLLASARLYCIKAK